jgi:hypothetical protein
MVMATTDNLPQNQEAVETPEAERVKEQERLLEVLRAIPGLRVPDHWPPRYEPFEPMPYDGEAPSEQLIRERR